MCYLDVTFCLNNLSLTVIERQINLLVNHYTLVQRFKSFLADLYDWRVCVIKPTSGNRKITFYITAFLFYCLTLLHNTKQSRIQPNFELILKCSLNLVYTKDLHGKNHGYWSYQLIIT